MPRSRPVKPVTLLLPSPSTSSSSSSHPLSTKSTGNTTHPNPNPNPNPNPPSLQVLMLAQQLALERGQLLDVESFMTPFQRAEYYALVLGRSPPPVQSPPTPTSATKPLMENGDLEERPPISTTQSTPTPTPTPAPTPSISTPDVQAKKTVPNHTNLNWRKRQKKLAELAIREARMTSEPITPVNKDLSALPDMTIGGHGTPDGTPDGTSDGTPNGTPHTSIGQGKKGEIDKDGIQSSASYWNHLLTQARKDRGPQWDYHSQSYQVDRSRKEYYTHMSKPPSNGETSLQGQGQGGVGKVAGDVDARGLGMSSDGYGHTGQPRFNIDPKRRESIPDHSSTPAHPQPRPSPQSYQGIPTHPHSDSNPHSLSRPPSQPHIQPQHGVHPQPQPSPYNSQGRPQMGGSHMSPPSQPNMGHPGHVGQMQMGRSQSQPQLQPGHIAQMQLAQMASGGQTGQGGGGASGQMGRINGQAGQQQQGLSNGSFGLTPQQLARLQYTSSNTQSGTSGAGNGGGMNPAMLMGGNSGSPGSGGSGGAGRGVGRGINPAALASMASQFQQSGTASGGGGGGHQRQASGGVNLAALGGMGGMTSMGGLGGMGAANGMTMNPLMGMNGMGGMNMATANGLGMADGSDGIGSASGGGGGPMLSAGASWQDLNN